ncbi:MAG: Lrp/AsnC family transcriptional regulator [Methylacidiphilales bacterium]|nr:Lrp/AsnC family transcriptional regulator [Candidatus Methylacidiphilales bacterium]
MDEALLNLLEENALSTPESLAAQLNTTPAEIKKRIKQLEKYRVILAYKAIVDDERAKRSSVKAVIEVRVTPEREGGFDRLAHRIAQYREVHSCFLMSGGFDLLVFIEGKTLQEVAGFVSEKLSTLPGVISTATHFNLKTYKQQGVLREAVVNEERLKVSP